MITEIRNELKARAIKQRANKAARKTGPNPPPPYVFTYEPGSVYSTGIVYSESYKATMLASREAMEISALLDIYHEARNTKFYQNGGSHLSKNANSWYYRNYAEFQQELREKFNLAGATKPQEGI